MRRHARIMQLALGAAIGLAVAACGDDGQTDVDGAPVADAAPVIDGNPDPLFTRTAGTISVLESEYRSEEEDFRYSRVSAFFAAAPPPLYHTETMRVGSCRLLEFEPASCEPFCDGICVDTNVCEPFPTYSHVGSIVMDGLNVPVDLIADMPYNYYYPRNLPIPEDLFAHGAEISATASGNELPGFSVSTVGVGDLVPDFTGYNVTGDNGADYTFTWTPGGGDARVRLTLNSPNEGHGQPYSAIIECDGPDNGSLTIAREIIEAFPETQGLAICVSIDCPPSTLVRYQRGLVEVGQLEFELVVGSRVEFGIVHPALP